MKLQNLIYIALVLAWFGPGHTAQAVSPPSDGGYPESVTPASGYAIDGDLGPTLPGDWVVVGVSDFNRDGHRDYALFNPTTRLTTIFFKRNPSSWRFWSERSRRMAVTNDRRL